MIKLFATDLDGTLLRHDIEGNKILTVDKEEINSLINRDVEFAVATGRMDKEIVKIFNSLDVTGHRVSQNGGYVYDKDGNLLHAHTFSNDVSARLHKAIVKLTPHYFVTTADTVHIPEKTELIKHMEEFLFFPLSVTPNLETSYGDTIFPSKFSLYGETDEIVKLKDILSEEFHTDAICYLSDKNCVDILPKGISKAFGINRLIEELAIKPEETAVIGDSYNDIPMLEMTPYSYAMASADTEVKEKASKVVNNVAEAIQDLRNRHLV